MSIEAITLIGDYVNGWVAIVCCAWVITSVIRAYSRRSRA